eukprot:1816601-Amphidinium_carterae.1
MQGVQAGPDFSITHGSDWALPASSLITHWDGPSADGHDSSAGHLTFADFRCWSPRVRPGAP